MRLSALLPAVSRGKPHQFSPLLDQTAEQTSRRALHPVHTNLAQLPPQHTSPPSPPGPASIDEKAAALEKIRQRREAARQQKQSAQPMRLAAPPQAAPTAAPDYVSFQKQPDASRGGEMPSHMLSPEQKANIIRMKMAEALSESEHARSPFSLALEREQTVSPEFSTNGYSAALHGAPQHHDEVLRLRVNIE